MGRPYPQSGALGNFGPMTAVEVSPYSAIVATATLTGWMEEAVRIVNTDMPTVAAAAAHKIGEPFDWASSSAID